MGRGGEVEGKGNGGSCNVNVYKFVYFTKKEVEICIHAFPPVIGRERKSFCRFVYNGFTNFSSVTHIPLEVGDMIVTATALRGEQTRLLPASGEGDSLPRRGRGCSFQFLK